MPRTKPTYFYAIASVALVLFVLGFFAIMALHGRKLVTLFKEKVDIWLELKPGLAQEDVARIVNEVRRQPFVKIETIKFITREQAAATMREDLGDTSMLKDMPDLLRDVIRFNVKAEFLEDQKLKDWREVLRQDTVVSDLFFEAANTGNVSHNIRNIGFVTLILGFLLVLAAITLIHNTIRLAMFSNRFLIKSQELVGASWDFISRPYIQRGIINGLLSALIAIVALMCMLWWLRTLIPELEQLEDPNGIVFVILGLILVGVLISGLSTWFVVNKFLRMRIDDLY
jgi:cell division transport system permease protein